MSPFGTKGLPYPARMARLCARRAAEYRALAACAHSTALWQYYRERAAWWSADAIGWASR